MVSKRTVILESLRVHAEGQIALHKANVEIYLDNPAGIGEHPDVMQAIESELHKIAEWEDQLFVLEKHFGE